MYDNFIVYCNRLSGAWISWMGISILESTLILTLISGLWLLLRKRSSPQLGYLLFLLIPLRLLLPLEVSLPGISLPWQPAVTTADATVSPAVSPAQFTTDMPPHIDRPLSAETAAVSKPPTKTSPSDPRPSQVASRATARLTLSSWLMLAWGAAVLCLTGRFVASQRSLSMLLKNAKPIDLHDWSIDMAELCRRIGLRNVRVLESEDVASPSVAGLWRPAIVLPTGVLDSLSFAQREWILLHELAHIRRRDLLLNGLQRLAAIVHFPNPAVWLANRQTSRLCEYACDDLASSLCGATQIETSEAFLSVMKLARARRQGGLLSAAAVLGMSRSRSQTECFRRMQRLLAAGDSPALKLGKRSLVVVLLAALVALPHLRAMEPPARETANDPAVAIQQKDGAKGDDSPQADAEQTPLKPAPYEFSVIVAKHVLLLDGKTITTWEEIARQIEAVPEPLYAYPHFYITRGAMDAGKYEPAKKKIWNLHKDYKLKGHSEGSLWPRTDLRFDRIKTADDLKPDPALRKTGTILFDGKPVAGAEVVLIAPLDESIQQKTHTHTYHMTLVEGRVRNRLEHVMTLSDEQGQFTLYPPKDEPYWILALHPKSGFTLVSDDQFPASTNISLRKWGGIVARFDDPQKAQTADLTTQINASAGRPQLFINQYWSDLKRKENTGLFHYSRVPTIHQTSISRSIPSRDYGSLGVPEASLSVLPGETRKIDFGKVTPERLEFMNTILAPPKPEPTKSNE